MAIAARWLAAHFNRPGFELFDYDVYALCSDGDMMEGVSGEAASIAGHLRLANLCWIYDTNHITIEGETDLAFSEDVGSRFAAYGWTVHHVADANDAGALRRRSTRFQRDRRSADADHRAQPHRLRRAAQAGHPRGPRRALGEEEVRLAKRSYGWPEDAKFLVPDGVYDHFRDGIGTRGRELREAWRRLMERYRAEHAELADELELMQRHELPDGWDRSIPSLPRRREGPRQPRQLGQGAERHRPARALADRRLGGPGALDQDADRPSRAPATSRPGTTAAATCISASASTRWARSATAWR